MPPEKVSNFRKATSNSRWSSIDIRIPQLNFSASGSSMRVIDGLGENETPPNNPTNWCRFEPIDTIAKVKPNFVVR